MNVTYWGHSCFLLETEKHRLVIDPFLTGNPKAAVSADEVKCDYVLVSHGHNDHVGDAVAIAKRSSATIIANYEIATYLGKQGVSTHGMHIGGTHEFPFGQVKLTIAHHGSTYETSDGFVTLGPPTGLLISSAGKTVYHAGDTGLFLDMKLIGELNAIDLALLPIGDNYTMGIDDAVSALTFLNPKAAIPMHYGTFPMIDVDPNEFAEKAKDTCPVHVLEPGETYTLTEAKRLFAE